MNDFTLTTMPPGGRGCGNEREKGGIYGSLGTSPDGTPVWEYLIDPPHPFLGDKFQGIIKAPPEMTVNLPDDVLLLLDMVSMEDYPSYASVVEEIARFGLSRRFPKNFDFAQTKGKRVMLGLLYWRGIHQWQGYQYSDEHSWRLTIKEGDDSTHMAFKHCTEDHFSDCIYWGWPLAWYHHESPDENGYIKMPWGTFNPMRVIRDKSIWNWMHIEQLMPKADYAPGLFGVFPLSHFETVGYVPDGTNVEDGDLPVVVMEE